MQPYDRENKLVACSFAKQGRTIYQFALQCFTSLASILSILPMNMSGCYRWLTLTSAVLLVAAETSFEIQEHCRLWLAPSSVSSEESPKLGLFAGVDYAEDDIVGYPEIAIPLIDFTEEWNRRNELDDYIISFLEGYLWTPEYAGAKWEGSDKSTVLMVPGHGVLANYHSGDYNVDWSQGSALLRTPPETPPAGKAHPSRGAITPYFNLTITATKPIKTGMEIFANFGEVWDANGTDVFQDRVTRNDYSEADKIIDAVIEFLEKYKDQMTPELADKIFDFIMQKILTAATRNRAKAIRSLIPAHPGKLKDVKAVGGTFNYRNPDLVKSKKWLVKHGTCVDNLKSGPSTIAEAGRGAFATRKLPKGTIIAPMPMLQIPETDLFAIYEVDPDKGEPNFDKNPVNTQVAMNYCFGHPESHMLLMPVGSMVTLINHQPPKRANAKVQWSNNKHWGNAEYWLDQNPESLVEDDYRHIGIVMEVVAIRDIKEGEEVFIDYGDEWQAAWDDYMKRWEYMAKKDPKWPLKADDMKLEYRDKPFKTKEELELDPLAYPSGVQTACFVEWEEVEDGRPRKTSNGKDIATWTGPTKFKDYSGAKMFACKVIDRTEKLENGSYNYTVRGEMQIENVPHAAITFVDKPYASDIHVPGAFRHPIGIPDEIFPQSWRDARDD